MLRSTVVKARNVSFLAFKRESVRAETTASLRTLQRSFLSSNVSPREPFLSGSRVSLDRSNWLSGCSWLASKLPKGFEDFFPEDGPSKPPVEGEAKTANGSHKTAETNTENTYKSDSKSNKNKNKHPPPPLSDDSANLPGLLALLGLIVSARHYLEQEEAELGREITFVDFRNHFLWKNKVEKLQVINKNMCKVVLKPNADATTASSPFAEEADSEAAHACTANK
jgi:hypothetical protein